ncbi:pentatricopeptide repeat protein [Hirsutella rhossiliensis]|uniref:Pentatricopeptide repeat protein n=1 Tax=Hirsutella rhossiliensis TaxID=111463 RepID=A0A9P8MYU0_9HYPO|nr:pentatricopeptide repeat protein [Hirsutella rhossiliensis]KAH0964528.1 pentatricopeptide repeat protein [Hirsutella rhossiliensis]
MGAMEASRVDQGQPPCRRTPREATWEERLLQPTAPSEATLLDAPVEEIVTALMRMRDPRGWSFYGQDIDRHGRIFQFVGHLLGPREQRLSLFMYECIMDAMADPRGSVEGVRKLLEDLESQGMKPTATMCQGALAALANHPDYGLRQDLLDMMRDYWFTVDQDAKQHVVVGLLRDEQYELAYARLTDMIEQGALVAPWVYDVFILAFGKLGFLDEMMLLLRRRRDLAESDHVVTSLLYYALDVCSQAFHREGTIFAWNAAVRSSMVQPPDGIVENVLATASRHGYAVLATEALDLLSRRARVLPYHYEAVVEAFAGSGDVAGALRVLCIMKKNGTSIGREHTSSIRTAIRRIPRIIDQAETALRKLAEVEAVPLAAASAVVEATAEAQGSERVLALYGDVAMLCGEAVEATTMQTLIMHSKTGETRRALARDYTAKMAEQADPVRSPGAYEKLITACAKEGELDLALRFAAQAVALVGPGTTSRRQLGWMKPLLDCAAARGDGRIWGVLDEVERRGDEGARKMVRMLLLQKRLAKRAAGRQASSSTTGLETDGTTTPPQDSTAF